MRQFDERAVKRPLRNPRPGLKHVRPRAASWRSVTVTNVISEPTYSKSSRSQLLPMPVSASHVRVSGRVASTIQAVKRLVDPCQLISAS